MVCLLYNIITIHKANSFGSNLLLLLYICYQFKSVFTYLINHLVSEMSVNNRKNMKLNYT